jgi:hypothetical protein
MTRATFTAAGPLVGEECHAGYPCHAHRPCNVETDGKRERLIRGGGVCGEEGGAGHGQRLGEAWQSIPTPHLQHAIYLHAIRNHWPPYHCNCPWP